MAQDIERKTELTSECYEIKNKTSTRNHQRRTTRIHIYMIDIYTRNIEI